MFYQICSKCGHEMNAIEIALMTFTKLITSSPASHNATGINTVSNAINLKCPNCGTTGQWISPN